MKRVFLLGACRTAIGSFCGSLSALSAVDLGAVVIAQAVERAGVAPQDVEECIFGNVLQAGQGQNPARQAARKAGLGIEVPAVTINKVCGSGLYAVRMAAAMIVSGQAECIVAGGMESMSNAPHLAGVRQGRKMGDIALVDSMIRDGLWDAFYDYHMGVTAENVAQTYQITREMQDAFAYDSQQKAGRAMQSGAFEAEIAKVMIPQKKGEPLVFDVDEYVRADTTSEKLARLKPAFLKEGSVTAGNASGVNDGAAAMIVCSEEFLHANGLHAQAEWIGGASTGVEPSLMGVGPVYATRKLLEQRNLTMRDIDLIEANEAFAAQALAVGKELKIEPEKLNVNGGAIALGHPIGASGARILVTLIHALKARGKKRGLATLCIGGGMGEAAVIENVMEHC